MPKPRIVITGMGQVTPLGTGVEKNWEAVCQGRSGIKTIEHFDVSDLSTKIAGYVDFAPEQFMGKQDIRRTDAFIHFALGCSAMAMEDSGLIVNTENAHRVGVLIGTGMGGLQTFEDAFHILEKKGTDRVSPFHIPAIIDNLASGRVAIKYGAKGPNLCVVTACSAGTHSIGQGYRLILHGYADAVIAGGTEASVSRLGLAGFCAMRALSKRNDSPEEASRPFDKERDGFVMGEGAGVLVLAYIAR